MQPIPYFGETLRGSWIYEPKLDGWRMQIIRCKDGRIECWGRRLERKPNWSAKLVYLLAGLLDVLQRLTLIDCELCSSGGRRFIPSLFSTKPRVEPIVYVFDMIYYDGMDISSKTLRQRKKYLDIINLNPPFYHVRGKGLTDLKRNYMSEVKRGHEGIVIKKLNSRYIIGKESPIATQNWRKIK